VNARHLHQFLEVGKFFANWITDRIAQYDLVEGRDYWEVFPDSGKKTQGGRPIKDYLLTMSAAKDLSMVERNEQGKRARRYFIACEERLSHKTRESWTLSLWVLAVLAVLTAEEWRFENAKKES
jgi:anti-repressor protein